MRRKLIRNSVTKRNPQDATLRNIRAAKARITALEHTIAVCHVACAARVTALEDRVMVIEAGLRDAGSLTMPG